MYYIVNDLHGSKTLIDGLVKEIIGEKPEIEKAWIYDTVHAGLFRKLLADRYEKFADCLRQELLDVLDETLRPISEAAKAHQVRVLYLPAISPIDGAFSFWTPNKMDVKRSDALHNLLVHLDLAGNAQIYFGHIHLGSNDARMAPYPSTMGFRVKEYQCAWVKPGTVLRI